MSFVSGAFEELVEEVHQYVDFYVQHEFHLDERTGIPGNSITDLRLALDRADAQLEGDSVGKVKDQYENDIEQVLVELPGPQELWEMQDCGEGELHHFTDYADWYVHLPSGKLLAPARQLSPQCLQWCGQEHSVNIYKNGDLRLVTKPLRKYTKKEGFIYDTSLLAESSIGDQRS